MADYIPLVVMAIAGGPGERLDSREVRSIVRRSPTVEEGGGRLWVGGKVPQVRDLPVRVDRQDVRLFDVKRRAIGTRRGLAQRDDRVLVVSEDATDLELLGTSRQLEGADERGLDRLT